jgi:hypothetical protein
VRPEVGIAIFDSHAAIGAGQGVYMSAAAALLDGGEAAQGIEAFSGRSVAHGAREWTNHDLRPGAGPRLYGATADSYSILAKDGRPDHRVPVRSAVPPSRDSARHQTTASQGRSFRPGGDWSGRRCFGWSGRRGERTRPVRLGQERGSYCGRGSGRRTRLRAKAQALPRSDSRSRESAPIRQRSPPPRNQWYSMPCSSAIQCVVLRS